jgi:hypothetical protein
MLRDAMHHIRTHVAEVCERELIARLAVEGDRAELLVPSTFLSMEYGPKNRSPLKWIMCVGVSATRTSVAQSMNAA